MAKNQNIVNIRTIDGLKKQIADADKSMEMYNGKMNSKFKKVSDALIDIVKDNGIVITFGYQSVNMGAKRGFTQECIYLMYHGGAIHDTIAVVERKSGVK